MSKDNDNNTVTVIIIGKQGTREKTITSWLTQNTLCLAILEQTLHDIAPILITITKFNMYLFMYTLSSPLGIFPQKFSLNLGLLKKGKVGSENTKKS